MVNFVLVEGEYDKIPALLKEIVPKVFSSPEGASLTQTEEKLPGVVCSRLAEYLVRLMEEFNAGTRDADTKNEISKCFSAIERLASSSDPLVQNVVVTEIFEVIDCGPVVKKQIKSRLGPKSIALYNAYIET